MVVDRGIFLGNFFADPFLMGLRPATLRAMDAESVQKAADRAVREAQSHYGPGWDRISEDARVGAAAAFVMRNFRDYAPDVPARVVVEVMATVREICRS